MPQGTIAVGVDANQQNVVFEQVRPNGEKVVAATSTFKGQPYLSIRVYYEDKTTGEWKPGKNGINLPRSEAEALFAGVDALRVATRP